MPINHISGKNLLLVQRAKRLKTLEQHARDLNIEVKQWIEKRAEFLQTPLKQFYNSDPHRQLDNHKNRQLIIDHYNERIRISKAQFDRIRKKINRYNAIIKP